MEIRTEKLEDAVKRAVEDAIGAEVRSCAVERRSSPSVSGNVGSHPLALTTFDTSSTLPDFVPLVGVSWPDPVKSVWRTFKLNSIVGLFPDISRSWITVDNKIILWNYSSGRDIIVYDEIPEIIVAVGSALAPATGVFQSHISLIFPVATPKTVHILGLCVVGDAPAKKAEMYVVNLGFSVMAPTLITKLVGLKDTGRIFAAGTDGCLYEVKYTKESTPVIPKIRLINHSLFFGGVPLLNTLSSLISTVKQTWVKQTPPLRDLTVDTKRRLLFTLDAESKISLWKITESGVKLQTSASHDSSFMGRYHQSEHLDDESFLVKIFCVPPHDDNCSLVAIASNGEQYRYVCQDGIWGGMDACLLMREKLPACIPSNREVSVCFVADGISLYCHAEQGDKNSSDSVTVATTPHTILPPHHHCRDIVTHLESTTSRMVRVDAIDEVPTRDNVSPNEFCSQVCSSPKQFVFAHRHGISTFMKLRPVDSLHMILSSSNHQKREALLQRFASAYSPLDYCCMLLQIGTGCTNVPALVNGPYIENGIANSLFSEVDKAPGTSSSPLSMEQLGCQLIERTSEEAQRLARENLRNAMMPSWNEGPNSENGARQIVVQVSPFASGLLAFVGRMLYNIWPVHLEALSLHELAVTEVALSSLVRLLNSLKKDVWSDTFVQPSVPFQWEQNKITLTFPPHASSISSHDLKMLQSALLCSTHSLCERVLQVINFVKRTAYIPLSQEERKITFSQIVCDQNLAHRLARYIGGMVMSSEQGIGLSQQERFGPLAQLQLECPYFFNSIDIQEYNARIQLDHILSIGDESLHTLPEAKLTDWELSVSQLAASLWSSGALVGICQQLKSLKREDIVIKLLLHAASQLDPSNSAFEIYLAERNSNRSQGVSSSLNVVYQEKIKALEMVVSTLEEAWNTHRSVVDTLLGGPISSGSIWQVEPADEMAHCFLFDWICVPRDDAEITLMLKETLSAVRSPFLEAYLTRNASTLGEQYAHYLRRNKKNCNKAIEVCASMAQASLSDMPREDRMSYRLRCWAEAKECAMECNSDQLPLIEQRMKLMEAQSQLSKVILEFINSGLPQLDRRMTVDARVVTERQVALEQFEIIESHVLSVSQLLQVAGMFCVFGGAEIQLDVLCAANVADASLYAACIERAFQRRSPTVEEIARRLLGKYAHMVIFPISHVAKILEAHSFRHSPEGSTLTVDILNDCGVDRNVIFSTFVAILKRKDVVGVRCEAFDHATVTDAFLVHSLSVSLHRVIFAPHQSSIQLHFLNNALRTVRESIDSVSYYAHDENSRRAITSAEGLLEECHLAATRLTSREEVRLEPQGLRFGKMRRLFHLDELKRSLGEFLGYCDVECEKGHYVDGNVWYADRYLYPNHWQPGSKVPPQLIDDGRYKSWERMSDVIARVTRLRERMKRKREEVHLYLDAAFYRQCRDVLEAVRRIDENGVFHANPSRLPHYGREVSSPMWWERIGTRLRRYEYADVMDFVDDMRLVLDNCYAYNGAASAVSAYGRRVELEMEDLFLTELAVAPPEVREIGRLGRGVNPAVARQMRGIICQYEGPLEETSGARCVVAPSKLRCATQRRVIAFLRANGNGSDANARAERPQVRVAKAVPKMRPAQPSRAILETDADVVFAAEDRNGEPPPREAKEEEALERVPQNQRSGFTALRAVSPVHLDESASDEGW